LSARFEHPGGGPREQFALNLRRARLEAGLSHEALGHRCNLHRTEISLLERGRRDPRLTTIAKLAHALKTSTRELLRGI
jgi:transcriptional regulator with XRE-family HTH domain